MYKVIKGYKTVVSLTNINMTVNAVKEILERGELEESELDSVQAGTMHNYVLDCEWKRTRLERSYW